MIDLRDEIKDEIKDESADGFASAALSLDWDDVFDNGPASESASERVSIPDSLIRSLNKHARVDIEYMSEITGEDMKTVISTLTSSGAIFQNPLKWQECYYLGFETADEYLSGNILKKIAEAKEANSKHDGYFSKNITALKKVLPKKTKAEDIYVTIGSPWLPSEYIDAFILHLFGKPSWFYKKEDVATKHDVLTGSWDIPMKSRYDYAASAAQARVTFGTFFLNALEIIERTLNQKLPLVYDEREVRENGKTKTVKVLNETESMLAAEKQRVILEEFSRWIFASPTRKKRIEDIYHERYGCVKARNFRGEFLEFPGLNPEISLFAYQKNAVARILFSPNTLLAHDVGAGKTYIMAAGGHELYRMGVSKKNLYVVPNNLTSQWHDAYLTLYPTARLLVVTPESFRPKSRQAVLEEMRDGDYEAIIIAYSCFDMIPLSNQYLKERLLEQQQKLDEASKERSKNTAGLKRRQRSVEVALNKIKLTEEEIKELGICFEELGVNTLFLDEAHNYKNIKIDTKIQMLGISESGSQKCEGMLAKVHCVQRQNGGRGVVFATGTPITNSVSDVYTMQRYLQNGELELLELQSFDSWVGMFAEKHTDFEVDVDATNFRMATRLSRFFNIPELTTLFASVTDFHKVDKTNDIPDFDGYSNIVIPKTPELSRYLEDISKRADDVRQKRVSRKEDNLLKITVDGRLVALDVRLGVPGATFTTHSKVYKCAERVSDIYFGTMSERNTQLVFCDISTPKDDFNIYDELKRLLVGMGVDYDEIAFIHDFDTDRLRRKLFSDVNEGKIRVLVGSTSKLGTGVNVQERLIAIHHLSVPWRPSDMAQREGRILRQGNKCKKVEIYRYITEGSFDSYIWQLLESKQAFIEDLLSGFAESRSADDVGDVSLDYGEIKALAVGNPLIKQRIECANMLARYKLIMARDAENREELRAELAKLPELRQKQQKNVDACTKDLAFLKESESDSEEEAVSKEDKNAIRDILAEKIRDGELLTEETLIVEYRGFKVMLPAGMRRNDAYVWLVREGRYYLPLGEGERGHIVRIDNYLNSMNKHLDKLKEGLKMIKRREKAIKEELAKETEYSEKIAEYRDKLEKLDKKLGVK